MKYYVGMDLHSNNTYVVIIDEAGEIVFRKKLPNDLPVILSAMENYKEDILHVVFESTYNWYWLGDGLLEAGYDARMANPAAITQYSGLKYTDDFSDAYHLAELKKLELLKEGYIYPKDERSVRDLLRKRMFLVQKRTTLYLNFEGHYSRITGNMINVNQTRKLKLVDLKKIFTSDFDLLNAKITIEAIMFFNKLIKEIEKKVFSVMKLKPEFQRLLTIPGIGNTLGFTIALETGDIKRFEKVGDYSSYARCAPSIRMSNDKKKGKNNRKNGNKYLAWAFVEAAHQIRRYCPYANNYYQRKLSKCKNVVAIKATGNKISKVVFHMLNDQTDYDPERAFGPMKKRSQ